MVLGTSSTTHPHRNLPCTQNLILAQPSFIQFYDWIDARGVWFLITRLVGNFAPLWFLALTYDDRLDFGDNPDGVSNSYKQVVDGTYISSILPIAKVLNYNITTEYTISSPSLTYVFFFTLFPITWMFQTASPIHYPFLASQLLAFPRGSILISTYP